MVLSCLHARGWWRWPGWFKCERWWWWPGLAGDSLVVSLVGECISVVLVSKIKETYLCRKGWMHHPFLHYLPFISPSLTFVGCYDGGDGWRNAHEHECSFTVSHDTESL